MSPAIAISITVFAIVAIFGFIAWTMARKNRTEWLRRHFGPEYDEALRHYGDRQKAEALLAERRDRMAGAPVHPLTLEQKELFLSRWHDLQAHFADDPRFTLKRAEALVNDAMRACGYTSESFEARASDLSVNHPRATQEYRAAKEIEDRFERGEDGGEEDLRRALLKFRSVFDELIELHQVH